MSASLNSLAFCATPLAIAVAAADSAVSAGQVDRLIAAWLASCGRLEIPAAATAGAPVRPGWAGHASRAGELCATLLPGWRIDLAFGGILLRPPRPPRGPGTRSPVAGYGPTTARSLLAALFSALLFAELQADGGAPREAVA